VRSTSSTHSVAQRSGGYSLNSSFNKKNRGKKKESKEKEGKIHGQKNRGYKVKHGKKKEQDTENKWEEKRKI
jgi:hypothetical protein